VALTEWAIRRTVHFTPPVVVVVVVAVVVAAVAGPGVLAGTRVAFGPTIRPFVARPPGRRPGPPPAAPLPARARAPAPAPA
jgi:hypothetical protein